MVREENGKVWNAPDLESLRLRDVLDALHEGFQLLDRELRYLYLNDAALVQARKSRDELIGKRISEAYPGTDQTSLHAALERCLAAGEPARFQNEFEYPDGQRGVFELRVQPVGSGLAILSIDVTERNALQRQLRHAQKMEAIGRLAGGVAHDFNNLLTVVSGFVELAEQELPPGSPALDHLGEATRAVARATDLTRKLLTFSREAPTNVARLDLNQLIGGMRPILERLVAGSSEISTRLAPGLWPVEADPGGLEQVILNLAVNARDAMPNGGLLRFETSNQMLEETLRLRWGRPIPRGDYVRLAVSDTGTGIAPEHVDKVFDPFFTTKDAGQGTGLGLSVCMGIVEQAGGFVNVYSEVGEGTTFRVYLPRAVESGHAATEPAEAAAAPAARALLAVVEDDAQIRDLMVRVLRRAGYEVVEIASSEDAAATLPDLEQLDLLITDVVMPRLRGPDLAARLRRARPDLPVLFVSGYPGGSISDHGLAESGDALLEKPFTPGRLLLAVKAMLGR